MTAFATVQNCSVHLIELPRSLGITFGRCISFELGIHSIGKNSVFVKL